jgi:hypothetical protein
MKLTKKREHPHEKEYQNTDEKANRSEKRQDSTEAEY